MRGRRTSKRVAILLLAPIVGVLAAGAASVMLRSPSNAESGNIEKNREVAEPDTSYWTRLQASDLEPRRIYPPTTKLSQSEAKQFTPWRDPASDPEIRPAAHELPVAHHRVKFAGRVWGILTYRSASGESCAVEVMPPEGAVFHCQSPIRAYRDVVDLRVTSSQLPGGKSSVWDFVWIWGFAAPTVRSLEVVLSDCSKEGVPIDEDRVFFRVFGPRIVHQEVLPAWLVILDRGGKLKRRRIRVDSLRGSRDRESTRARARQERCHGR